MKLSPSICLTVAFCLLFVEQAFSIEVGDSIPSCVLNKINKPKDVVNLDQYKGQVIYLDFWASWCGPCVKSFPYMNDLEKEFKSKGLQVIAVNLDENIDDAYGFLEKVPANFMLVQDANQQCAKDLELKAMPTSYLIDRKGVVRHIHLGFRSGEVGDMQSLLKQLLSN